MKPRVRRLVGMILAAGILLGIVAAQKRAKPAVHVFQITLGLKDQQPSDWSGKVEVVGGEVQSLEGWRFEEKDQITSRKRERAEWRCGTHLYIAPGERYRLETPGQPASKVKMQPWPNGVTLTLKGDQPQATLTLAQGKIAFKADEIQLGEPKTFLNDQVRIERLPEVSVLRPPAGPKEMNPRQDDYPALWIDQKTNRHYLAWVCYQNAKDRILLAERDGPDGDWSEPVEVAGPGDHFRVALAGSHGSELWIVWSSQVKGNWDLYARRFRTNPLTPDPSPPRGRGENGRLPLPLGGEGWGEGVLRLTDAPGPHIWHRMTTDLKGRAWLVWQGARDGQFDIFARCADAEGWHEPIKVSDSPANDWDPCICADTKEDRVWVGWDTYEKEVYDVRIRSLSGGFQGKLGEVMNDFNHAGGYFRAHVTLACDHHGWLWAAWDESGENWGKDTGLLYESSLGSRLYTHRRIGMSRLIDGKWWGADSGIHRGVFERPEEFDELPQLQPDSEGRMWLAFRRRTSRRPREDGWAAQARWDVYAIGRIGEGKVTELIPLPHSAGRNDMRIESQRDKEGNAYFAYATDHRTWTPPAMTERNLAIAVSCLSGAAKPEGIQALILDQVRRDASRVPAPVHPNEKAQVARIRAYKIDHAGKTYRIYRGDLHRHTDISGDGVGDGSLMDLHRYGLDASALDFILVADHNMGNDREYPWWRTQKANDLYTIPGRFISMYGYERSVRYPNGHRNIIWTERGHRTLPLPRPAIPAEMAKDTGRLYEYLRTTNGICTAHSSATEQGTDWKEVDGRLEPIVEIFQGFQSSYEMPGGPLAIDEKTKIVHQGFRPDGFVSNALDKGHKLGFQASSDHVSTHVSYACVLAEEFSRKGLVEAMKKRHTYAATDNIILDVRAGRLGIMGDEVATNQPQLDVVIIGTGPIDRVEVIRNGKVVHTARPQGDAEEAKFSWQDPSPEKGKTTYYYVRVVQKNRHTAWGSPIWFRVD